jgi:glycosyltransferase involved in cell wall biosynthesis
LSILSALRQCRPDVVLYNLQFASFGDRKIPAALGLITPALSRLLGVTSVVLLHNLMDTIDLRQAGFGGTMEWIIRFFGELTTRLILMSNLVALTIPKYVELLEEKYHAKNVLLMPHGAFEDMAESVYYSTTSAPILMTFGKFGTYKKVEPLLEAYKILLSQPRPPMKLIIAGTDSPNATGYLAQIQQHYADLPGLQFTGYVPEEEVATLFKRSTIAVFPYSSTTGSSGVLHQAAEYGTSVVLPHIGDFVEVLAEEGYTGKFFEPENSVDMARAIADLLDHPSERIAISCQNYRAAHGLPMSEVVDWYLLHLQRLFPSQPDLISFPPLKAS